MSVESKLFVTCGKEDLYGVADAVINALNVYSRKKLDDYWENNTDAFHRMQFLCQEQFQSEASRFSNGCRASFYNMSCISFDFKNGDENSRSLRMLTDCSCDYSDTYDGDKIIFSLGYWGSNDEIMQVVAKAVSAFGDVYYDFNDCDDQDFVKLYSKGE